MSKSLIVLAILAGTQFSCDDKKADEGAARPAAAVAPKAQTVAKAQTAAPKAPVKASGAPIGVPECDEFLKKRAACAAQLAAGKVSISMDVDGSRELAKDPEGREILKISCKSNMEMLTSAVPACK